VPGDREVRRRLDRALRWAIEHLTDGEGHSSQIVKIVPGDPEASLLYRKLVDRNPPTGVQMPQDEPPIDSSGMALLRQWILAGASTR